MSLFDTSIYNQQTVKSPFVEVKKTHSLGVPVLKMHQRIIYNLNICDIKL